MESITLEIDGKTVAAEKGTTVSPPYPSPIVGQVSSASSHLLSGVISLSNTASWPIYHTIWSNRLESSFTTNLTNSQVVYQLVASIPQ